MVRKLQPHPATFALLLTSLFPTLLSAASDTPTLNPSSSGYVSPKLCFACHSAIYKTFLNTGMAKSFARPRLENKVEDFTKNTRFYHEPSKTYFEMLDRDGTYFQRRYQLGYDGKPTNIQETKIDYYLGSGIHARAYLHRSTDGRLLQLPVTWYSEKGGYWWMAPGYDQPGHIYEQRTITYDCIFCHNAYESIPTTHTRLGDEPVYAPGDLPEGVECQRCHGPGEKHVQTASKPDTTKEEICRTIVNPAKLPADRQAEVCLQCHLQTTEFSLPHVVKRYDRGDFSYRPGQSLADFELAFDYTPGTERDNWFQNVSTASRMRMSQCFIKSQGSANPLKCTTCHNPHNIQHGKEAVTQYNTVCLTCHTAKFQSLVAANKHTAASDCVSCHMPLRRPVEVVHIVKTDHFIRRRAEPLTADIPERHETQANSYRGKVQLYYPQTLPDTPENRMYLAIAQVRDSSNLNEGIPQLVSALAALKPTRPEPWFELASAYLASGSINEAITTYRESLRIDPSYSPSLLGLAAAFRQSGQLPQAAESFEQATQAAPDNPRAWNELGQVNLDLERVPQAQAALKQAIALAPEMPQPHNGLGIALAQGGDFHAAEAEFREAIRLLPNYGEAHGNLAGVLDLEHDTAQAFYEFDLAVHLAPNDASTHFNYGSLLAREKRLPEAQVQMEAAVRANPNFAEAHELLGRFFEQKQQLDNALREYQAAVRLRPDMSQAQLDLGAVLAKRGDIAGATEHLRQASSAADPTLRQIAQQLLEQLPASPK